MATRWRFGICLLLTSCSGGGDREKSESSDEEEVCSVLIRDHPEKGINLQECQKSVLVTECKDGSIKYSSMNQNCSEAEAYGTDLKIPDG